MFRKLMLGNIDYIKNFVLIGDDVEINGLNLIHNQSIYDSVVSYVTSENFYDVVKQNFSIRALIVSISNYELYKGINSIKAFIISDNPEKTFYELHEHLLIKTDFYNNAFQECYRGSNVRIGSNSIVSDGVCIGDNSIIGNNTIISSNTIIGNNCIIGSNCVIGSEGFQIIKIDSTYTNITHVGGVRIGDNTHIGDNCVVSKNLFESYNDIKNNVMMDCHVYVAHNCTIDENVVITSGVKICGTVKIEKNSWIGMNSTLLNKVIIAENTVVGIGSVVTKNTLANSVVYGNPARCKL